MKVNRKETTKTVDSGCQKTLTEGKEFKWLHCSHPIKRIKLYKPYGSRSADQQLPIQGCANVTLETQGGATVNTWIHIMEDTVESLLGQSMPKSQLI